MLSTNLIPNSDVTTLICGRAVRQNDSATLLQQHFSNKRVIAINQQHTNNCLIFNNNDDDISQPADAILTDRTDVVLTVRTADCLPILLYHPSGIIGAIHAGRKGTELSILKQTLLSLKANWGVEKDVQLWFGPAICHDCYQVNREPDLRYNLRGKNRQQAEIVFPYESIQIIESEHCTFHQNDDWYSYRKEGKGVPMNWSAIGIVGNK